MDLNFSLTQKQSLSQRMQLSVKILQMNSVDLEQYIRDAALENPMIELEEAKTADNVQSERLKKLEWLDAMDESRLYRHSYNYDAEESESPVYENRPDEDLSEALTAQVPGFHLDAELEAVVRYLIDDLDDNGYLTTPCTRIADDLNIGGEQLDAARAVLWRMDPAGVGAADLRECLLIQARRQNPQSRTLIEIIDKHLDALAKNRLAKIAKELDVPVDAVKEARSRLLALNPKPGNGYSSYNFIPYIRPDLFVVHFEESFQIILNDYNQPQIAISSYYRSLAGNSGADVDKYISERLGKAEWLISCIGNRKKTILRCAEKILLWQMRFFENGPGFMAPMTLSDIAEQLGVHPSTVSRAVDGKYLQCQWGVFRLGDFFSRAVSDGGESQSQDSVLAMIKRMIDEESKDSPLSDQQIADALRNSGIAVARRTVAKYREQLQIPTAKLRREY